MRPRELGIGASLPEQVTASAQVGIVGLRVFGRLAGDRLLFLRSELDAQRLADGARNLVLQFEDIGHFAIVALRPQRSPTGAFDQLRVKAEAIARTPQTSAQNVRRA